MNWIINRLRFICASVIVLLSAVVLLPDMTGDMFFLISGCFVIGIRLRRCPVISPSEQNPSERNDNNIAERGTSPFFSHAEREERLAKNTRKTIAKADESSYNEDSWSSEESTMLKAAFKELTLADSFIFYKVMQDKELCKRLLEIILDVEIERIEYPEGEKTIEVKGDAKGIRLDIYVKDEKTIVYNVEMQAAHTLNLPQRSRYYQSLIDVNLLGRGEDYRKLNRSFVIFICMEDIFHKGRHIYTFENRCREDTDLVLGDGTVKIFLNPYSEMNDVTPELGNFLRYLAEGIAADEYTRKVEKAVETAKRDPRLMVEYMSYYADQADHKAALEESRAEGLAEGMEKGRKAGFICGIVQAVKGMQGTVEVAAEQLSAQCGMNEDEALAAAQRYW